MDTFLEDEVKEQKKSRGEWARMNVIQKSGAIGFFVLLFVSLAFVDETYKAYVEVGAQTSIFLGWVAGSLWKVRHALHFWWSLLVATLGHLCLLSTYLRINRYFDSGHHSGREVGTVTVGMIAAETIIFLVLLRKVAMWIHRRSSENSRTSYANQ
jgi:Ni/Fe-hydrogenase subunit HybB-like protein